MSSQNYIINKPQTYKHNHPTGTTREGNNQIIELLLTPLTIDRRINIICQLITSIFNKNHSKCMVFNISHHQGYQHNKHITSLSTDYFQET